MAGCDCAPMLRAASRSPRCCNAAASQCERVRKPSRVRRRRPIRCNAFGAVFVEVHVDPALGIVRVPRVVGAYGVGRLLNAKTAHSQLMGGIVWGLGMALFEETVRDVRNGRYVNGTLAEYHVPVNADVQGDRRDRGAGSKTRT